MDALTHEYPRRAATILTVETISIREVDDADWDAIAELRNYYLPQKTTGELQRRRHSQVEGEIVLCRTAHDELGKLLAYSRTSYRSADPKGLFRISLFVDPSATGRGLGKKLLAEAEAFARAEGAAWLVGAVEANCERGMEFAREAGAEPIQHLFQSKLDLTTFDSTPFLAHLKDLLSQGYQFRTFADFSDSEERWQRLYSLDTATDVDTPGSEHWGLGTCEEYRSMQESSHGYSDAGVFVVLSGEEWVGMHIVKPGVTPGEVSTDYTGVKREHRGKGLALCLKTLGLQHAKAMGGQTMVTSNDERNAPMLAVNQKLGFVAEPGFYMMRKPLV